MVRLARAQGFDVLVADQHDAQPGDVLLMWIGGEGHCGLMSGDGRFLHHNRGGLSHEAVWDGWYRKHAVYLLRWTHNAEVWGGAPTGAASRTTAGLDAGD
jgi:cell wall-associated NlpC family hydrolase